MHACTTIETVNNYLKDCWHFRKIRGERIHGFELVAKIKAKGIKAETEV
jgi:hypothetical protein